MQMREFHVGQAVLVTKGFDGNPLGWRKAKIVMAGSAPDVYLVECADSTREVIGAEYIRAALPLTETDYDPEGINKSVRKQLAGE
jgi:hypothetical protein